MLVNLAVSKLSFQNYSLCRLLDMYRGRQWCASVMMHGFVFSLQNLETVCKPIVTKPKPKVEPPKDEKKEGEGEEAKKEGETAAAATEGGGAPAGSEGEAKMEEDGKPTTEGGEVGKGGDEDMDLD